MKRLLSIVLSVIMICSVVPMVEFTVNATEAVAPAPDTNEVFTYDTLDDGTISITAYNGDDEILTIPETIDGYTVTSIGKASFYYKTKLKSVTIPDSVTEIGMNAFADCSALESVKFSENLKTIGACTFSKCTSLKSVVIPDSVETIGNSAFYYCTGLTELHIGKGVETIREYAFEACIALENLTIPENVKNIEKHAFSCCEGLKTLTLSNGIESIGGYAFTRCIALAEINFPENDFAMGFGIFSYCTALTEVTIEKGLTKVADSMFRDCTSLKRVVLGDSVKNIEQLAFAYCSVLSEVELSDSIKGIDSGAFASCDALTKITFPAGFAGMREIAFFTLTEVTALNPFFNFNNIPGLLKITGYENSTAQKFAEKNSIEFVSLGTYSCTDYNEKHKEGFTSSKEATYFEKGYTNGLICTTCKNTIKEREEIPELKLAKPVVKFKAGKKNFKVKYTKVKDATGFEVKYTIAKKPVTKNYKAKKTATKTINKLSKGTYKVKVRAFIKDGTKIAYSKWTKAEKVKVK